MPKRLLVVSAATLLLSGCGSSVTTERIFKAIEEEDKELLVKLVAKRPDLANAAGPYVHPSVPRWGPRRTKPLVLAAEKPDGAFVKALLDAGADTNGYDEFGQMALHVASSRGHIDVVRLLLVAGADADTSAPGGKTALQEAMTLDRLEVAKCLIEAGADVNAATAKGRICLHECSSAEMAKLLMSHGSTLDSKDIDGDTPLHCAIRHGHPAVVGVLVDSGARVDIPNNAGKTAYQMAQQARDVEPEEEGVFATPVFDREDLRIFESRLKNRDSNE